MTGVKTIVVVGTFQLSEIVEEQLRQFVGVRMVEDRSEEIGNEMIDIARTETKV